MTLSHSTAAAFHGFHLTRDARVHLAVDTRRWHSVRGTGIVSHRSELSTDDVVQRGHVRVTSPVRTVIDLACGLPGHEGLAAADRALRLGVVEKESLLEYAQERLFGRTGRRIAQTVAAWADRSAESPPESHLRWHYIASHLPVPRPQTAVPVEGVVYRADLGYRFARLGSEYDSDQHHADGRQRRRDRQRDDGFRAAGWLLLYVTSHELYREPADHLAVVDRELRRRGFDPLRLRRSQRPGRYLD